MRDGGKGIRDSLEGVDLLGFGTYASERTEANQGELKKNVTAKVGKPTDQQRSVTAKVGKPLGNLRRSLS